jgi:T5orf172 domain
MEGGFVYLLLEVDKDGYERHKIGISKNNPNKRLKQLQTGNSNVISLLSMYQSKNYKKIELWLHGKYSNKKTESNNEWFTLSNDDVLSFLVTCEKINESVEFLLKENQFFR